MKVPNMGNKIYLIAISYTFVRFDSSLFIVTQEFKISFISLFSQFTHWLSLYLNAAYEFIMQVYIRAK